jgi:hypothetical protein
MALVGLTKSVTGTLAATGITNPVPLINQPLVPDAVALGGTEFTLTINGTALFLAHGQVERQGTGYHIRYRPPANGRHFGIGHRDSQHALVTVVNPRPGGGTSNVVFFPITNPNILCLLQ